MATKKTEDVLLTPQQVHERTGVALQTLANWRSRDMAWRSRDTIPANRPNPGPPWIKVSGKLGRPGGEVRYPERALKAWQAKRAAGAEVPPVHRATLRPSA